MYRGKNVWGKECIGERIYRGKNKLHNIILNNNKGKTAAYSVKEYKMKIILYKFSPIHSFPYTSFPLYILSPR